jgi:hypothetical protein
VSCIKGALGLGKNLALRLLDISESGVRFTTTAALDRGQEIEVRLENFGYGRPIKALANVVWCVTASDGTFCIGALVQKRLPYCDFQAVCR